MTWYSFLLWVHVTCAVVWVGGGLAIQFFAYRLLRENEPVRVAGFARDTEWVGMRVFLPASLLLIVSAVLLMIEIDFGWGQLWVVAAIVIWIASFAAGAGFFGPEAGRLAGVLEQQGPSSPEYQRRLKWLLALSRFELSLLLAVVFLMTVKPSGDDLGAVAIALAIAVVGAAVAWRDFTSAPVPAAPAPASAD